MRVFPGEVVVFLVGQGFQWTGIDDALTARGEEIDGELRWQSLARASGTTYETMMAVHYGLDGVFLEIA